MTDNNPTTRMFPRTMEEAFPGNVEDLRRLERAIWFEPHQDRTWRDWKLDDWWLVFCAFGAGWLARVLWNLV